MERKFAYLCGLVLLVACADSRPLPTPTSPTPMTPTPAPCPPCPLPGVHALSGVVRVAGVPMAGAKVGLVKLGIQSPESPGPEELIGSRVTDGDGSYSFPSVENVSFSGALVSVFKADYFTDTKYILMSQDRQLDFDLEQAVNISVGQVILSQIGEARCASTGYGGMGGAVCRRFALPLHASGTLEIAVSSSPPSPFDITVLRPDGTIGIYAGSSLSPLKATLAVAAGSTYQIDVVHINQVAREFELTTTLR
jgi:hypothetical protein